MTLGRLSSICGQATIASGGSLAAVALTFALSYNAAAHPTSRLGEIFGMCGIVRKNGENPIAPLLIEALAASSFRDAPFARP